MSTYIIIFFTVIIMGAILGVLSEKKKNSLQNTASVTIHVLSVIGGVGVILYLVNILLDIINKPTSLLTIIGTLFISIAILATGNLIYRATSKYTEQKHRTNIAEYQLYLIEKGSAPQEIKKRYNDLLNGRQSMQREANIWANTEERL